MRSKPCQSRAEAKAAAPHASAPWQRATVPNTAVSECVVSWGHQVQLALGSASQETSLGFRFSQVT